MTDPKNPEAINEELDLEELKGAAGGISSTSGPGGTSFPEVSIGRPPEPELWREMQNKADTQYPNPHK